MKRTNAITILLVLSVALTGCSAIFPDQRATEDQPVFRVAYSKLPQEPVYNRVKPVYLPSVLPKSPVAADASAGRASASLAQVYNLDLSNVTLEKAASALAAIGGYDYYVASSVAEKKITLKALGTIEELALAVSNASETHVVVDHPNRQVRIVAKAV